MSNEDKTILEAGKENPLRFCIFRLEIIENRATAIKKFDIMFSEGNRLTQMIDVDINEGSIVLHDNSLYVVGGFSLVREYYSVNETRYSNVLRNVSSSLFRLSADGCHSVSWQPKANLNKPRYEFGCTVHNDEIFVAGGEDDKNILNSVESYNPMVNQWKTKPHMIKYRAGCALASKGELLYALGGRHRYGIRRNTVEIFDSLAWKPGQSMLIKRSDFQAVVLNNEVYAIGGHASYFGYLSHVEKLTNGRWKEVASLNIPRSHHQATVACGKIYVLGGENMFGDLEALEIYDPSKNEWSIEELTYFKMIINSWVVVYFFSMVFVCFFASCVSFFLTSLFS